MAAHPDSYMAVTRGLEDLEVGIELTADGLLASGRRALDRLLDAGAFGTERGDQFYVYRLSIGDIEVTGLVAGVAVDDYVSGQVHIHEHIKAARAIHLANHLDIVGFQSSPIAMAVRHRPTFGEVLERATDGEALLDVTLDDGLRQRVWAVTDSDDHERLRTDLDDEPLYLIDGHHRAAAAATFRAAAGPGMADWMLTAIFDTEELVNAPHHRVFRTGNDVAVIEAIGRGRRVRACHRDEVAQRSDDEIGLYADGQWYCVTMGPSPHVDGPAGALERLDPRRYQAQILGPLFRVDPEGDDPRLTYIAGSRPLDELEAAVDREGGVLAFLRAVPIGVLLDAADVGLVMPPKSTYFQPKVRSGVFLRATTEQADRAGPRLDGRGG